MRNVVLPLIAAAFLGGCVDGAGPELSSLSIKFGIAGSTANPSSMASFSVAGGRASDVPSHIEGSNGDLNLTEIWVIVEEFELKPVETDDCDDEMGPDDCEDFELKFFFIDVPLDGTTITVVTADIPDGTYDELEFEVEDVEVDDDDEEDQEEAELIRLLFEDVRRAFPMWPEKASLVVVGTWTPKDADGNLLTEDEETFTTYFEAEIEVELDLDPPLEVSGGIVTGGDITILVRPDLWFTRTNGTVWNLADLQDQLVEFELEIEDGFELEIEIDD